MEKIYNEDGGFAQFYIDQIKTACAHNNKQFFEDKLKEADDYFEIRQKHGWPNIKNEHDLRVECQIIPFVSRCIKYLNGELKFEDN